MNEIYHYNNKRHNKGFTLLEVLVVLILLTLIISMVFQIFSFVFHISERAALLQIEQKQQKLQLHWFKNSVAALHPDNFDAPNIFKGNPQNFTGISLAPLNKPIGVPTLIQWEIVENNDTNSLRYYYSQEAFWDIMIWKKGEGKFSYKASNNKWYPTWPPRKLGEQEKQLPEALLFTCLCDKKTLSVISFIKGHKEPQYDFRKAFDL